MQRLARSTVGEAAATQWTHKVYTTRSPMPAFPLKFVHTNHITGASICRSLPCLYFRRIAETRLIMIYSLAFGASSVFSMRSLMSPAASLR